MLKMAKLACEECRFKPDCRRDFGDLALRLSECDVEANTVIGGDETRPLTPVELTPLGDEPLEALKKIRLALQSGALDSKWKGASSPFFPEVHAALTELVGDKFDNALDVERVASTTCGAMSHYNRRAHGEHRPRIDGKRSSRFEPLINASLDMHVAVGQIVAKELRELYRLGIDSPRNISTALQYGASEVARAIGWWGALPEMTPGVVRRYVMQEGPAFERVLHSHVARIRYFREVLEPRLQAEFGHAQFTNGAVSSICANHQQDLEAYARTKIAENLAADRAENRVIKRDFKQSEAETVDKTQYYDVVARMLQPVEPPAWIVRRILEISSPDNMTAITRNWRKNYTHLMEKYDGEMPITRTMISRAAFSNWPEVQLEILRHHRGVNKVTLERGNKLLRELRAHTLTENIKPVKKGRHGEWYWPILNRLTGLSICDERTMESMAKTLDNFLRQSLGSEPHCWRAGLSQEELEYLVDVYARDVCALMRLSFSVPPTRALYVAPIDYLNALQKWDGDEDLTQSTLQKLLSRVQPPLLKDRIGNFRQRMSHLRVHYGDLLGVTHMTLIAENPVRFSELRPATELAIETAEIKTLYPWARSNDIECLLTNYKRGLDFAKKWFATVAQLRVDYSNHPIVSPGQISSLVPYGEPEFGAQKLELFLAHVGEIFSSNQAPRGLSHKGLFALALNHPKDFPSFLKIFSRRVDVLRRMLGDVEDFVINHSAAKRDYTGRAEKWQIEYSRLHEIWSGHEYYKSWMGQWAAFFSNAEKRIKILLSIERLTLKNQLVMNEGRNGRQSLQDVLPDSIGSPEEQYIELNDEDLKAGQQQKREAIAQLLGSLTEHERAAVVLVCNLAEELAPSHLQDEDLLKEELGVKDLTTHVMSKLIPKMQKAAGDSGII